LGHGGDLLVLALLVDGFRAEGTAAEQPDRLGGQFLAVVVDEPGGILEKVDNVGGTAYHERVVRRDLLDGRRGADVGLESGAREGRGDPFGDALGGTVSAGIGNE